MNLYPSTSFIIITHPKAELLLSSRYPNTFPLSLGHFSDIFTLSYYYSMGVSMFEAEYSNQVMDM